MSGGTKEFFIVPPKYRRKSSIKGGEEKGRIISDKKEVGVFNIVKRRVR